MSRNIKEIGKELMGKSLNSFHRRTGLTQLEENNKMQDGILDGILSQVDDAYIEKTEQSNVIHLDGSGDGVVVLDSIEGNTMVNILGKVTGTNNSSIIISDDKKTITFNKPEITNGHYAVSFNKCFAQTDKTYTLVFNIKTNTLTRENSNSVAKFNITNHSAGNYYLQFGEVGLVKVVLKQPTSATGNAYLEVFNNATGQLVIENPFLLEGDWRNKEIPSYVEGLQSSFEEKINDEGKYEIEILSQNENIFNIDSANTNHIVQNNGNLSSNSAWVLYDYEPIAPLQNIVVSEKYVNGRYFQYRMCYYDKDKKFISAKDLTGYDGYKIDITPMGAKYFRLNHSIAVNGNSVTREEIMVSYGTTYRKEYIPYKQNKIKLLINEPLRGVGNTKDRLCIKNNKLLVERNCGELIINGTEPWTRYMQKLEGVWEYYIPKTPHFYYKVKQNSLTITDKVLSYKDNTTPLNERSFPCVVSGNEHWRLFIQSTLTNVDELKQWLQTNPITVIYELAEPYYEEVVNEYGEPILLEGYENGTIYIDSTIVPTTSVRYTPKMESFKTLKEVNNNNIMLTNDVNDNIIPYMMDVDLMIMEKEMALMSHKNIRTIGVKDMTSMQKRTQDMLTRLIKGKTLTEQECKTRVVTYLDAGKITDAQADELMLLISEVYA